MSRPQMGVSRFDLHWFSVVNHLALVSPALDKLGKVLAGDAPEIWAVLLLLFWFWPPLTANRARRTVVYAAVSAVLALAFNYVLTHTSGYQPRPFVYLPPPAVHQLLPHVADSAFPSDTTAGSFGFATAFFYAKARDGWWAWLLAAAIGVARVFVGLHWPNDILVGALDGVVAGLVVLGGRRALEPAVQWLFRLFRFAPARAGQRV
ncbi:MAG: phosphatase PAP2 family protein [Thermaerobacter sp.]|nr:phosphatase PAP2 family protein [Thermaerobacter sp.]